MILFGKMADEAVGISSVNMHPCQYEWRHGLHCSEAITNGLFKDVALDLQF